MQPQKSRVIFVCPYCRMTVKPEQTRQQVEGEREDTLYYAHRDCYERRESERENQ